MARPTHADRVTVVETAHGDAARASRRGAGVRRALRNRLSAAGVVLLGLLVLAVVFGPLLWTQSPTEQDLSDRLAAMSARHPLGTDALGRDVLSRILHGGRTSLSLAVTAVAASALVGGAFGLLAGYLRGAIDSVLMRIMEVILAFPALLLALAISAATSAGVLSTLVAVAVPGTPLYARLVRSLALSVRERDYILAARAAGVPPRRLVLAHVLPNSVSPLVVQATIGVGLALQYIAALGYLGLGVQPPTPEWGAILSDAQTYLVQEPLVLVAPGLVIALAILSFNLLGDALRDLLDPGGSR